MRNATQWLSKARLLWTCTFSLFFLLNLDQFGVASGLGPAPKYWITGTFLVSVLLFLPDFKPARLLRRPIFLWALAYVVLSILWLALADNMEAAGDGLVLATTTCLFVGMTALTYPQVPSSSRAWRICLWLALILGVSSILQEYYNPSAYVFAAAGQGITGRAAGLYLNPNTAAQTMVLILACLMLGGSPTANVVAAMVTLLGVFPTFSRGGMLAWAVLVFFSTLRGRLPRWLMAVIMLCALVIVLAGPQVFDALSVWISPENRNSLDRLAWLLGQGTLSDYSAGERDYIFAYGWEQFLQAPLFGHGLGYMWVWPPGIGTHNLILRHLVEYGIFGVWIFPVFLLASIKSAQRGTDHAWLWMVAGIALLLSVFSHNMLEQGVFLLPWLALCLMPVGNASTQHRREPTVRL